MRIFFRRRQRFFMPSKSSQRIPDMPSDNLQYAAVITVLAQDSTAGNTSFGLRPVIKQLLSEKCEVPHASTMPALVSLKIAK